MVVHRERLWGVSRVIIDRKNAFTAYCFSPTIISPNEIPPPLLLTLPTDPGPGLAAGPSRVVPFNPANCAGLPSGTSKTKIPLLMPGCVGWKG